VVEGYRPRLCDGNHRGTALNETAHRSVTLNSGDVTLAYHAFGSPGGETPILIMHGSNYYDSTDWLGVAAALATDREVVTFDLMDIPLFILFYYDTSIIINIRHG
jgi:hypothetical protein